jgi:DNA (cytosine-5)-methyltransferase 1
MVGGSTNEHRGIAINGTDPSNTVTANTEKQVSRAVLIDSSDIRALDYRCLARLQSFPDWYHWGSSAGKNCKAIGNAIPPLFAQRGIESILGH